MYNIVESARTDVFCASRGHDLDDTQLVCLMHSQSIAERIVKYGMASMRLIVSVPGVA